MAERGAQPGNQNAAKGRMWSDTLKRALLAEDGKKLRALADKLIDRAMEGDTVALKEVGDRLDGKPNQSISNEDGSPVMGPLVGAAEAIRNAVRG